jgi:hypothetical protein
MNLPRNIPPRRQCSVIMFSLGKLDIDRFALRHAGRRLRNHCFEEGRPSISGETNVGLGVADMGV